MRSIPFWTWFDAEAAPKLGLRETSFRKTFDYLDRFDHPVTIVETGCARARDNWAGDGQSTVLFDRYLSLREAGGRGYSIDLEPRATELCRQLVGPSIEILTGDSVPLLLDVHARLRAAGATIDLLYLDSFDLDWDHPVPSAVHHLKELVSIAPSLRRDSLVVVDDAPGTARVVAGARGGWHAISSPQVGGKGLFVAQYAQQVGASPLFASYQAGWTAMVR